MAKKFEELRARMSAEARARSEQKAADMLAETDPPGDLPSAGHPTLRQGRERGEAPAGRLIRRIDCASLKGYPAPYPLLMIPHS